MSTIREILSKTGCGSIYTPIFSKLGVQIAVQEPICFDVMMCFISFYDVFHFFLLPICCDEILLFTFFLLFFTDCLIRGIFEFKRKYPTYCAVVFVCER